MILMRQDFRAGQIILLIGIVTYLFFKRYGHDWVVRMFKVINIR